MELVDILSVLKDASPWVVLGSVVLGLGWLYSDFRKSKLHFKQKQLERSEFAQILAGIDGFKDQLQLHTAEDQRMIQTLNQTNLKIVDGIEQVVRQLMSLNSMAAGHTVSPANSRTFLQYQWNWCRDETIKILITSIERNHIDGRETAVASQVFRAWKRTAADTKASIEKFEGLAYDPELLINQTTLNKIWGTSWAMALPIYLKDFAAGSGSLEDHKTELIENMKSLFDQIFSEFVACLYEADHGDSRSDRSSASLMVTTEDMNAVQQMVEDMRGYKSASGKHEVPYALLATKESDRLTKVKPKPKHNT